MKTNYIALLFLFLGSVNFSAAHSSSFTSCFEMLQQEVKSIKVKIRVEYLGNPLEGVSVSIIDNGRVLAKSTTDKKGKVKISIKDLSVKTVDLKLSKQGFKTQLLSGIILIDKSKYEFSLEKGDGVTKSVVETDIPNIEAKSAEKIQKHLEKMKKYQEKAKSYAQDIDEENQKRRAIEKETSKIKKELRETQTAIRQIEERLAPIATKK